MVSDDVAHCMGHMGISEGETSVGDLERMGVEAFGSRDEVVDRLHCKM